MTAAETAPDAAEVDYLDALLARQHAILTGVANALRGDPGPLASHSHHDLAERAAAVVALLEVAQTSLAAATSGRRVTACDEIERLQRERDAALGERDEAQARFGPRTQDGTDPRCSVEAATGSVTYCASMAWMLDADDRHFRVGLRVPRTGEAYGAVVIDVKGKRFSFCDYCPFCGVYIARRAATVTT